MATEIQQAEEIKEQIHVVILHHRLRKRPKDRYIIDLANALQDAGHKVSIYTSFCDTENCYDEVKRGGTLNVYYSTWWMPRRLKFFKAVVMALRMIFFPPKPRPKVIMLDINAVATYLFGTLSKIRTIYISHFTTLQQLDAFTRFTKIEPDLISAIALQDAHEILVQSEGLAEIFHRSFPSINIELKTLFPCVDTGLWCESAINVTRIIPDLPKPNFMFVCFGMYKKRSNFKVVLDAFEDLLLIISENIKNQIHLVIAGQFTDIQIEQKIYYYELLRYAKEKSFASQVTFLRQLPVVHKKTLIEESIGVLIPSKYDVFPETILAALAAGRPIIATNSGFAKEALKHRITGILVDPLPQMFAAAMYKLLTNPAIQLFLSDMSQDVFKKNYSNCVFRRKINAIVMDCIRNKTIIGAIN